MNNGNTVSFSEKNVLFFGSAACITDEKGVHAYLNEACHENPLIKPILTGNVSLFRELCTHESANRTAKGQYPLYFALMFGKEEVINDLIRMTDDINRKDKTESTILMHAFRGIETAARLARRETSESDGNQMPFGFSRTKKKLLNAAEKMITAGADVNTANVFGETALSFAVHSRQVGAVRLLIENGANACHGISRREATPFLPQRLRMAIDPFAVLGSLMTPSGRQGRKRAVSLLKEARTPYEWGVFYGDAEILALLEKSRIVYKTFDESAIEKMNRFKKTCLAVALCYVAAIGSGMLADCLLPHKESEETAQPPERVLKGTLPDLTPPFQKER